MGGGGLASIHRRTAHASTRLERLSTKIGAQRYTSKACAFNGEDGARGGIMRVRRVLARTKAARAGRRVRRGARDGNKQDTVGQGAGVREAKTEVHVHKNKRGG